MNTEKLAAEAAAWLVRCESSSFTAQDRAGLEAWLAQGPQHRAVYMRLRAAWDKADQFRRLRPPDATVNEDLLTDTVLPSLQRADRSGTGTAASKIMKRLLLGAGAALLLVAAAFVAHWMVERPAWRTYTTDIGGFERVLLPEGSTIHMNTDSRIRVRISATQREVQLERGEAFFNAAHDPQRPFSVDACGTTIRAIGTAFAVRLRETKGVDVLVTEGQVTVAAPRRAIRRLGTGQTLAVRKRQLQVVNVEPVQVKRKMAWMSGQLLFEQQTLAEMAQEFNRYNRRQIAIADPAIAELRMSAGFNATDPDSFVAALRSAYGIRALPAESGSAAVVRLVGAQGSGKPE